MTHREEEELQDALLPTVSLDAILEHQHDVDEDEEHMYWVNQGHDEDYLPSKYWY